jgi:hypothetical protein
VCWLPSLALVYRYASLVKLVVYKIQNSRKKEKGKEEKVEWKKK